MLTPRKINILKIIVEEYIETGNVLGSKLLLKKYDLGVSSATVRNDMAELEELQLVYQPYNSAGRLPTSKGIRAFVEYLMKKSAPYFLEQNEQQNKKEVHNFYDLANTISHELATKTEEIGFFVMPDSRLVEFSGTGRFLENNHTRMGDSLFSIIKMLEDKKSFLSFLESMNLNDGMHLFIGEENIIEFLQQYTIIIKKQNIGQKTAYIGVIGSLKMNYSFNISAVNGIM